MRITYWFIFLLLIFSAVNGDNDDDDDDDEEYDDDDNDEKKIREHIGEKKTTEHIGEKSTTEHIGVLESVHGNRWGQDIASGHCNASTQGHGDGHGIRLVSWRWSQYGAKFCISFLIIFAVIAKITFHHAVGLSKVIPESVVLITIGFLMAIILSAIHDLVGEGPSNFPKFTADIFFNILLPPIILDAAFALFDREFLANFRSVMTFAIVGTLINIFAIGSTLYGLSYAGAFGKFYGGKSTEQEPTFSLTMTQCLIFSSLISAVDPVAVLAIFEEIHVNMGLYFLVFGESLLNDGVTVVLYNTMISMETMETVGFGDIILASVSFLCVFFGGFLVGMLWGTLVSFITTKTTHVRVVEPLLIFSCAYMAFVFAEIMHWSGILSIIGFGLTVKRYAFANISQKSYHSVKYATKTLASVSDCIIFMYLGSVLWLETHEVNWAFIVATIVTCLVFRLISTFFLSWITNKSRGNKISIQEQIIMAYGGLRGAVGFSLACVLADPKDNCYDTWFRHTFLTGALAMVIFTVFLQGTTIKPLVKLLNIKLQDSGGKKLVSSEMQLKMVDDMMAGIEIIVGNNGTWTVFQRIRRLDQMYIKKFLIKSTCNETLQRKFEKIILDEHFANLYAPNIMVANQQSTPQFKSSPSEDLKSLSVGIYNNQMSRSSGSRYMVDQLEIRQNRTKTMEGEVMRRRMSQHIPPNDDIAQLRITSMSSRLSPDLSQLSPDINQLSPDISRQSSRLSSTMNRSSVSSQLIKSEYDTIQANKKKRISQMGRSFRSQKYNDDISPLVEEDYNNEDLEDVNNGIQNSPV